MAETYPSFCRICPSCCPIIVTVENGRAVDVNGDRDAPLYEGYTCPKGRALPEQHNNPARLLSSMKRGGEGRFAPIASTQAIEEIAARVTQIIGKYGPRSVALYFGTGIASFPEVVNVASAWMAAIGSPLIFSANGIDKPGAQIAQAAHGIWSAWHPPFEAAEAWILIGLNPLISKSGGFPPNNPGRRLKEAIKERGLKLIVIDPRATETARRAHIFLQPVPGEDPAILAALLNVVVQERLYDKQFVAANVAGLDVLSHAVAPFTPDYVARRADVSAEQLVETARIFARARYAGIGCGVGPSFALTGALTDYLALCLTTLCGHWARAGETVQKPNVLLPPYVPHAEANPPFQGWGYDEKLRVRGLGLSASGWPTGALAEEILLEGPGQIRALFCLSGNPMMAWPDQHRTLRALRSLELLVTNDHELGATARLSHYVIAPKLTLETPSTTSVLESIRYFGHLRGIDVPYARYTSQIVEPPAGSDLLEDWEFFHGLAKKMGLPLTVTTSYGMGKHAEAPPHSFTLKLDATPSTDELLELIFENSRIPLSEIKKHPVGRVFHEADQIIQPKRSGNEARLDVGNPYLIRELQKTLGRQPVELQDPAEFLLISRRANKVMNSGGRSLAKLAGNRPYNAAFIHPEDLARLSITSGERIKITSQHGWVLGIAEADHTVRRGCLSMTHGYGANPDEDEDPELVGCNVGRLMSTGAEFDPITGIPRMGALPVKVEPVRS